MQNKRIQNWIEENYPDETPMLFPDAGHHLLGVGWQFTNGPTAVYDKCMLTDMLSESLPPCADGTFPPLLITRCSLVKPTRKQINEWLEGAFPDNVFLLADGLEGAFLGVVETIGSPAITAYSEDKCIDELVLQGMDYDEAYEFFHINTVGAWVGELTPMFIDVYPGDTEESTVTWTVQESVDGRPAILRPFGNSETPMIRMWPPALAGIGSDNSAERQSDVLNAYAFDLAQWLNNEINDRPVWLHDLTWCGDTLIGVGENTPGMCIQVIGPVQDAQPTWAFSGMQSGEWEERMDADALIARSKLLDRIAGDFDVEAWQRSIEAAPEEEIQRILDGDLDSDEEI